VWTWAPPFPARFALTAKRAALVTAGSTFLRDRIAEDYPATPVVVVPTAVDTNRYVAGATRRAQPFTVGWVGGPASLTDFTEPVLRALRSFVAEAGARVKIVCSEPLDPSLLPSEFEAWSMDSEVQALQSFDVGIMPLRTGEQSWGRCGLKALQYMAVGLPVVASPIGAAVEIIEPGRSGILAESEEEWTSALRSLASSHQLRAELGRTARTRVVDHYSVATNVTVLVDALERAARS
jgi:glycosyltransferase involved in cell wall biosynthesis